MYHIHIIIEALTHRLNNLELYFKDIFSMYNAPLPHPNPSKPLCRRISPIGWVPQ